MNFFYKLIIVTTLLAFTVQDIGSCCLNPATSTPTIPTGVDPAAVVFSPNGNCLIVPNNGDGTASLYSVSTTGGACTLTLLSTIPTTFNSGTNSASFTADGLCLMINNIQPATIPFPTGTFFYYSVDPTTCALTSGGTFTFGGLSVSPIYISNGFPPASCIVVGDNSPSPSTFIFSPLGAPSSCGGSTFSLSHNVSDLSPIVQLLPVGSGTCFVILTQTSITLYNSSLCNVAGNPSSITTAPAVPISASLSGNCMAVIDNQNNLTSYSTGSCSSGVPPLLTRLTSVSLGKIPTAVAFSPDGTCIAVAFNDNTVSTYAVDPTTCSITSSSPFATVTIDSATTPTALSFTTDGTCLVVANSSNTPDTAGSLSVFNIIVTAPTLTNSAFSCVTGSSTGNVTITGTAPENSSLVFSFTDSHGTVTTFTPPVTFTGDNFTTTFTIAPPLVDGTYTITATINNCSPVSNALTVIIDIPAPPTITATANCDGTVTISGTSSPSAIIDITISGTAGTTTIVTATDSLGNYSVTTTLPTGTTSITATTTNCEGTCSTTTLPITPPTPISVSAPIITSAIFACFTNPDTGAVTGTLTVMGTGQPDSTLTFFVTDAQGNVTTFNPVPPITVDHVLGTFVGTFTIAPPLTNGDYTITAVATSGICTSPVSNAVCIIISVPCFSNPTATATANCDGTVTIAGCANPASLVGIATGGTPLQTITDDCGKFSVTTTLPAGTTTITISINNCNGTCLNTITIPAPALISTPQMTSAVFGCSTNPNGSFTNTLTVTGTTQPNASLTISLVNSQGNTITLMPTVIADGLGNFSHIFIISSLIANGAYSVTATASNGICTSSVSNALCVTIAVITQPTATATAHCDGTVTIAGCSSPSTIIIISAGTSTIQRMTDSCGNFSVTTTLPTSITTIAVTATNCDGTCAITITIPAPTAISISTPHINTAVFGCSANPDGSFIGTLTVTGTGQPGSSLTFLATDSQGTITTFNPSPLIIVDALGNFSGTFTIAPPLASGTYSITATATNGFCTTAESNALSILVAVIAQPVATATANSDGTVTIAGCSSPETMIVISAGGTTIKTATNTCGNFSVTATLPTGTTTITITATNCEGTCTSTVAIPTPL